LRKFGERIGLDPIPENLQRRLRPVLACGEFVVEPVERPVEAFEPGPDEPGLGGVIVVAKREQKITREFEVVVRHPQSPGSRQCAIAAKRR
jgi:hypothetical protein